MNNAFSSPPLLHAQGEVILSSNAPLCKWVGVGFFCESSKFSAYPFVIPNYASSHINGTIDISSFSSVNKTKAPYLFLSSDFINTFQAWS